MAKIETAKKIIKAGHQSKVGIWLWGGHGIGKSDVIKQTAQEMGIGFIDVRAALTEAGDWMGLPIAKENNKGDLVAQFCMSSFLPQDKDWKGILFLDELNRASNDTLNCVFQLVLSGEIQNHYKLPEGVSIVSAGNPNDGDYSVTDIDPALSSRFCHIPLTPTKDEWFNYASKTGVRNDLLGFVRKNDQLLETEKDAFDLSSIKPSRRGVNLASKLLDSLEANGDFKDCHVTALSGLLGLENAVQFSKFLESDYAKIDVDQILKSYDKKTKEAVKSFVDSDRLPEQKQAILSVKEKIKDKKVDAKTAQNILSFMLDLSPDVVYSEFENILTQNDELIGYSTQWMDSNEEAKKNIADKIQNLIQSFNKIKEEKAA